MLSISGTSRVVASCCLMAVAACATSTRVAPVSSAPLEAPAAPANPSALPDQARLEVYRAWISEARIKHPYPETEARMYAVMMCESEGRAAVVNPSGRYSGLFQYATQTWRGAWNIYRNDGILNAKAQIFATALAWSLKMQSQWGCYKTTG